MEQVQIPSNFFNDEDLEKIQYVYQLARAVKLLSLIDLVFSFSFILFSPYLSLFSLLYIFICYFAFRGSKDYNNKMIIPYIIVNILKNIGTILLAINNLYNINLVVFMVVYFLIGCYITYIIVEFYLKLTSLNEEQRNYLKQINNTYIVTLI